MADVVEASLDVTFKNPLRRLALVQVGETLLDCIVCASSDSESVGVEVTVGLSKRFQCKLV